MPRRANRRECVKYDNLLYGALRTGCPLFFFLLLFFWLFLSNRRKAGNKVDLNLSFTRDFRARALAGPIPRPDTQRGHGKDGGASMPPRIHSSATTTIIIMVIEFELPRPLLWPCDV